MYPDRVAFRPSAESGDDCDDYARAAHPPTCTTRLVVWLDKHGGTCYLAAVPTSVPSILDRGRIHDEVHEVRRVETEAGEEAGQETVVRRDAENHWRGRQADRLRHTARLLCYRAAARLVKICGVLW